MTNKIALHERSLEETRWKRIHKDRFVRLKTHFLKNLYELSKRELNIYIYLLANINRDNGYHDMANGRVKSSKKIWANLDKYYENGWLVTARTQKWIEKETGIKQSNISVTMEKLEEMKLIQPIGTETVRIGNSNQQITIYSLGQCVKSGNEINEIFYYELDLKDR